MSILQIGDDGVELDRDLASVQESVAAMHAAGIYPPVLFE